MKTTWGKYPVFQRRHIITVSVNDGIVTETNRLNRVSGNPTRETPKVVMVHKDPPKIEYREAQHSRYALPLVTEKLNVFLLGVFVGAVLALLLVAWLY